MIIFLQNSMITQSFEDHQKAIAEFYIHWKAAIERSGEMIIWAMKSGQTLFICGNGWSASDSQHIAAEFTGRYLKERRSLPAVALTTDSSALTAIGNDYGFERVFSRQLEWLWKPGDILLAISTSGNSKNVILAVEKAKEIGMTTIWLLGRDGGMLRSQVDEAIVVPSQVTARVQEGHILAYHILCEMVDNAFENE
jgi:D-sedoheptulose 7-phosphate isomerase